MGVCHVAEEEDVDDQEKNVDDEDVESDEEEEDVDEADDVNLQRIFETVRERMQTALQGSSDW